MDSEEEPAQGQDKENDAAACAGKTHNGANKHCAAVAGRRTDSGNYYRATSARIERLHLPQDALGLPICGSCSAYGVKALTGRPRGRPARVVGGVRVADARPQPAPNAAPLQAALTVMLAAAVAAPPPAPLQAAPRAGAGKNKKHRKPLVALKRESQKPRVEDLKRRVEQTTLDWLREGNGATAKVRKVEVEVDGELFQLEWDDTSLTPEDIEKV
jgi:hypothetical protein